MHVIDRPNEKGMACNVRQHAIKLPRYNYRSMPHYPNYRLGPVDGSPCDTLGINNLPVANFRCEPDSLNPFLFDFIDNSWYAPTEWHWAFGDGTDTSSMDAAHAFPGPGAYQVCLTVSNDNGGDTACKEVAIPATNTNGVATEGLPLLYPQPDFRQGYRGYAHWCGTGAVRCTGPAGVFDNTAK